MNAKAKEPREPQRGDSERYTTDQMVVVFVGRRLNKTGSPRRFQTFPACQVSGGLQIQPNRTLAVACTQERSVHLRALHVFPSRLSGSCCMLRGHSLRAGICGFTRGDEAACTTSVLYRASLYRATNYRSMGVQTGLGLRCIRMTHKAWGITAESADRPCALSTRNEPRHSPAVGISRGGCVFNAQRR